MKSETGQTGEVIRIAGPVVAAIGLEGARLFDVVRVGELGLTGEVIRLSGDLAVIQIYEESAGLRIGEPVVNTREPFVAYLGPGLLGSVYDGLQRPLEVLAGLSGAFIQRGLDASSLDETKRWDFSPLVSPGEIVSPGDVLGVLPEKGNLEHRVMVPPGPGGRVVEIRQGELSCKDTVAVLESMGNHKVHRREIKLTQTWPVRQPRPVQSRLAPQVPLLTGTRIIDVLFPIARGGSAIIPGGFGTGKTVTEHSLASWAEADVVVYVGCGERGNEMTEVLEEFPTLVDPRSGALLMDRTVMIANTSNMPVAAREASIYTGISIAEYYRDMGYDVLLLADSTSRWGEALREISGRLEEMPGEEGYPAYLAARLAEFYERSGSVVCLGGNGQPDKKARLGSVSVVGAVSPPGGDFSEPITQHSMRIAGTFWGLDYDLSRRRHFPAINWTRSYSLYDLSRWYTSEVAGDWAEITGQAMALLQREVELLEIVRLVGPDALAEIERAVLAVTRVLREDFLQQFATHEVDRYCPVEKAYWMLKTILVFHDCLQKAMEKGAALEQMMAMPVVAEMARMKEIPNQEAVTQLQALLERIKASFAGLGAH